MWTHCQVSPDQRHNSVTRRQSPFPSWALMRLSWLLSVPQGQASNRQVVPGAHSKLVGEYPGHFPELNAGRWKTGAFQEKEPKRGAHCGGLNQPGQAGQLGSGAARGSELSKDFPPLTTGPSRSLLLMRAPLSHER